MSKIKYLYDTAAYDGSKEVPSYWRESADIMDVSLCAPLEGDQDADVAIIGAGFTGLNAAIRLASDYNMDVAVLDSGYPGWGASGRNAGFCVAGGARRSPSSLIKAFGEQEFMRFEHAKLESIEHVKSMMKGHNIDADIQPEGEWQLAYTPKDVAGFEHEAEFLKSKLGVGATIYPKSALREMGVDGPGFHGGLLTECGFGLHPLKYATGLAKAAYGYGVRLHSRSPVHTIQPGPDGFRLICDTGTLKARRLLLATNGYGSDSVPREMYGRTLPIMSNIIVTRPLTRDEREAQGWLSEQIAFDTRKLIHYFRLLKDGRFLFGMRAGIDASGKSDKQYEARIRQDFEKMFPEWRHVEHTNYWKGFICMTQRLLPYIGRVPNLDNAWAALAYHGNGVAMGSWAGCQVADQMAGAKTVKDLPAIVRGPLTRIPFAGLRRGYLKAAFIGYGLRDRLHQAV